MNPELIRASFQSRVCEQIDLVPEGQERFRVVTPFRFEDGDHFGIVLKREAKSWILTDEASTMMHLSYWMDEKDLDEGNRREIIDGSLSTFSVVDRDGELVLPVEEERFGDALFDFVQALTKVTDISFLSRERVRTTFLDDFKAFFLARYGPERVAFAWNHPSLDPKKRYPVDCRVNSAPTPLFVCALPSDGRVKESTINLLMFERWHLKFHSLGIFEEQESINPRDLARFTDVVDKTFSSLDDKDRISRHLDKVMPVDIEKPKPSRSGKKKRRKP